MSPGGGPAGVVLLESSSSALSSGKGIHLGTGRNSKGREVQGCQ